MTKSFHNSNLGWFGGNIPVDLDGYVHLTIEGWLAAPMDGMTEMTREEARDLAKKSRDATRRAEAELALYNSRNS